MKLISEKSMDTSTGSGNLALLRIEGKYTPMGCDLDAVHIMIVVGVVESLRSNGNIDRILMAA